MVSVSEFARIFFGAATRSVRFSAVFGLLAFAAGISAHAAPVISSISPIDGTVDGGTTVTITGTGFVTGSSVTFGGMYSPSVTFVSSTTLTAITPTRAAGKVSVVARPPSGTVSNAFSGYTFKLPTVSSVSPTSGTVDGGTTVTVNGTYFVPGSSVTFGGINAAVTDINNIQFKVITPPANVAGIGPMIITTPRGYSSAVSNRFTYKLPAITSISPTSGSVDGGTVVTINGSNFVNGSYVLFDGNYATNVTFVSATKLTAVAPPANFAGLVNVEVVTPGGWVSNTYSGFTYKLPVVSSISPTSGSVDGGTTVTINGSSFVNGSWVLFDGNYATNVTFVSATKLTAVAPPANFSGLVNVEVVTPGGWASNAYSGYTYKLPVITSISPTSGSVDGGNTVTITGSSFVNGSWVLFDGNYASSVSFVSATSLTAVTPAANTGGLVDVHVVTPTGWASNAFSGFTYKLPTVTSVSPATGSVDGGTMVTVTGSGFAPGSTVSFGGIPAATTYVSATSLQAVTPPGVAGPASIEVTTPTGWTSAPFAGFTYQAPTVTAISPAQGEMSGGDVIIITGSGFIAGMGVSIGGNPATDVVFVSATTLNALTPSSTVNGVVDVVATTPLGYASAAFHGFTYVLPAPQIEMLDQTYGIETGGTAVTIIGTNFQAGATVRFGGVAATSVTMVNATTLTLVTPAHVEGLVDVTVTNPDNQSVTLANAYNYLGLPPTITAVDPAVGPTTGGTAITITGTGFKPGAGVTLGGVAATSINIVSATTITAVTAPYSGGTVDVTITNPGGVPGKLSLAYTYQMVCTGYAPPVETDPIIVITSPMNGAAVLGDRVNVTGTYSGPEGTGITVNGIAAITDGYYFYANAVPVAGTANLDARAATPYGKSATSSVQVTATGIAPIELDASINQGAAPLAVTFSHAFTGTPQTIAIDYNGDGLDDFTTSIVSAPLTTTYAVPGIYKARLTITDTLNQIHTTTTVIEATNAGADDAPFQQSYSRMRMALLCGNIDGALTHFTAGAKERYRPVFEALQPHMVDILNTWSPLQKSEITPEYAEFAVNRLINGVNRIFFLYFVKDEDGVWRLDTM